MGVGTARIRAALVLAAAILAAAAPARAGQLKFSTNPGLPTLTGVTLNGGAQTTLTTWDLTNSPFAILDNNGVGWNLTLGANTSGGSYSAVLKQYCPNTTCGTDTGPGYVTGGYTLPANSLTMTTTGAGWTTGGTTPAYQCAAGCRVDSATAVKIVSASTSVATGTWTTSGSAALSLTTPSTLRKLQAGETYRVDLVWTLNSGP
jgi:hypothetical protein